MGLTEGTRFTHDKSVSALVDGTRYLNDTIHVTSAHYLGTSKRLLVVTVLSFFKLSHSKNCTIECFHNYDP